MPFRAPRRVVVVTPETWKGLGLASVIGIEVGGSLLGGALLGNWLFGPLGALGGLALGLAAGTWLAIRTLPTPPPA